MNRIPVIRIFVFLSMCLITSVVTDASTEISQDVSPTERQNSEKTIRFNFDFPAKEWVFYNGEPQQMNVSLKNTTTEESKVSVVLILTKDDYSPVDRIVKDFVMKPGDSIAAVVPFKLSNPGFYRCTLFLEKDGISGSPKKFNIGYEPEKIVSPVDAKPDLQEFWDKTKAELARVAPEYKMTLLKERSTGTRNIYHVEMMSFGNVKIEGFYAVPKAEGKYPAILYYMGYASDPWCPDTNGEPGFASFVLSVRGQGIQKATSTYGDWIIWGLDSKENYYYRGAFMDVVRSIDFLSSRPEVDADKIVAEGGSQGGAFTLVACALDRRIKAGAPAIPFLSDYTDYFRIVNWPRSSFETYLKSNPTRTWAEVYDVLTYFDVKNLASWIKCPIFMAAGLQDEVCPNHTNFAVYNQIKSKKQYRIYRNIGHSTPRVWYNLHMDFFREALGLKK
jgi:cephalosporin-C deacetylase